MQTHSNKAGILWLKISVIYLIIGVSLGIMMGASQNFTLRPVHAHVNLVGWAVMAVAGLIYSVYPQAGVSKLGKAHFWLHNLAMPVMMISLGFVITGNTAWVPALMVGEFTAAAGILVFAANLYKNLK